MVLQRNDGVFFEEHGILSLGKSKRKVVLRS